MMPLAEPSAGARSSAARGVGERELKFSLPASRVDLARRLLDRTCRRDREFPAATVWTVYFDRSDLRSLHEKINSDYLKTKVRLRWYSDLSGDIVGPAFVEAKSRTGALRRKIRVHAPHPADAIATWSLQDPRLRVLPLLLRAHGLSVADGWEPVLLLRYRRDRFLEPASLARVSLDADIRAAAVNPRFISTFDPAPLHMAVLEIKGGADELPGRLRPMIQLGARQRSFSKYLAVYQHLTHTIS